MRAQLRLYRYTVHPGEDANALWNDWWQIQCDAQNFHRAMRTSDARTVFFAYRNTNGVTHEQFLEAVERVWDAERDEPAPEMVNE